MRHVLLFQIAVGDIVVAPVGHCIELQAVGELHLFGFTKLLELLPSLALSLGFWRPYWVAALRCRIFVELEGLFGRAVAVGCKAVQGGSWLQIGRKERQRGAQMRED
jgi:hypothetical protein